MILLEVLLLYRMVLAILGFVFVCLFVFHMKLKISLLRSIKHCVGIFMEIALNL